MRWCRPAMASHVLGDVLGPVVGAFDGDHAEQSGNTVSREECLGPAEEPDHGSGRSSSRTSL